MLFLLSKMEIIILCSVAIIMVVVESSIMIIHRLFCIIEFIAAQIPGLIIDSLDMFGGGQQQNVPCLFQQKEFRSGKSWKHILQDACQQINKNLNPLRLLSVSTTLCHFNGDGMVTVTYDGSNSQQFSNDPGLAVGVEHYRSTTSWKEHRTKFEKEWASIAANTVRVIAVNHLEINREHHQALTVLWYVRRK